MDKPKPVTIVPYLSDCDYGGVDADYTEEPGSGYYREDEMDAYLQTLTNRILDLEAKLRQQGDVPRSTGLSIGRLATA